MRPIPFGETAVTRERDNRAGKGDESRARRLREIAQEASNRLDSVLIDGQSARRARKPTGAVDGGGESSGASDNHLGSKGIDAGRGGDQALRGDPAAARRGRLGRSRPADSRTGPATSALVSHVSPGLARMVANLLRHMGLAVSVASTIEELDRDCHSRKWDLVFLQGASMPYPCERLVKATLERCAGPGVKLVLLKRPGEELIPALADIGVSASIEWPFEQERVRCEVSDLMRGTQ